MADHFKYVDADVDTARTTQVPLCKRLKDMGDGTFAEVVSAVPSTVLPDSSVFSQTTPTVTNASGVMLAANAARKYLLIQNNDAAGILYINFGATATTTHTKISPAGGYAEFKEPTTTQAIHAIGSIASNANIAVTEG